MPPPPSQQVRDLIATLEGVAEPERSGTAPQQPTGQAGDENPVADAVHRVQAALT